MRTPSWSTSIYTYSTMRITLMHVAMAIQPLSHYPHPTFFSKRNVIGAGGVWHTMQCPQLHSITINHATSVKPHDEETFLDKNINSAWASGLFFEAQTQHASNTFCFLGWQICLMVHVLSWNPRQELAALSLHAIYQSPPLNSWLEHSLVLLGGRVEVFDREIHGGFMSPTILDLWLHSCFIKCLHLVRTNSPEDGSLPRHHPPAQHVHKHVANRIIAT